MFEVVMQLIRMTACVRNSLYRKGKYKRKDMCIYIVALCVLLG